VIENRPEILRQWITPWSDKAHGPGPMGLSTSHGMSEPGYDIRLGHEVIIRAGYSVLGISLETVAMPETHKAEVGGKSTLARLGVSTYTTAIDPGFRGRITIEMTWAPPWPGWWRWVVGALMRPFTGPPCLVIPAGTGIGTLCFASLARSSKYAGKYQDSMGADPVEAR